MNQTRSFNQLDKLDKQCLDHWVYSKTTFSYQISKVAM